jgi:hypothetical protein
MKTRTRSIPRVCWALAAPLLLLLPGAARADTLVDRGLTLRSLGAATLGYDPLGRVAVGNLGASGADGVAIDVPDGGRGAVASLDLSPGGLAAGQRRTVRMRAWGDYFDVSYDLALEVGFGNTLLLAPDGSAVGATAVWVEVLSGDAAVLQRAVAHGTTVQASGPPAVAFARDGRTPDRTLIAINQPGVKIVSDDHAQWIEVRFAEPVTCDVAGTVAMGDAIRFVIRDALPVSRVAAVEFLGEEPGGGPGSMAISQEGIPTEKKKGICHGLGGARFGSSPYGGIAITNLGASGQDGVSIGPESADGGATDMAIRVATLEPNEPPAPGTQLEIGVTSRAGTVEAKVVLGVIPSGDTYQAMADFSAVGATALRFQVMEQGVVQAELANQLGGFAMPAGPFKFTATSGDLRMTVGEPGGPAIPFTIGPVTYVGDRLEITAEPPPGPGGLVSPAHADVLVKIECVAGGIPRIDLLEVDTSPGPAPLAGVPAAGSRVSLALGSPVPNPAPGSVAVALALPARADVRAAVLDASGRRVRDLGARRLAAGAHRLEWDGRDDRGRAAPAGVYFLSVVSAGSTRAVRCVRVR